MAIEPSGDVDDVAYSSIPRAARNRGVHPDTIRRMVKRGDLPAYHVPGTSVIRIKIAELDALFQPVGGNAA